MKKTFSFFYFFFFCFFIFPVFSETKESFSPISTHAGEIVEYNLEGEFLEIEYPKEDIFLEDSPGMSIGRVLAAEQSPARLTLRIRFYVPGKFTLPISWLEKGERKFSKVEVEIKSNLAGNETDLQDVEPPEPISGFLFWRLLIYLIFFLFLFFLFFYFLIRYLKKPKIVDAIWERPKGLSEEEKRKIILENYLNGPAINQKELAFLFTSYGKTVLSERFSQNLENKTDAEFLFFVYERSKCSLEQIRDLKQIFQIIKYSNSNTNLSQEEARSLIVQWNTALQLGLENG